MSVPQISTPNVPASILENDNASSELPSFPNVFPEKPKIIQTDYRNDYPDYKTRASGSSFDTSTVGSLDYKERVNSLCKQIVSANIGDPSEFGCISDQNSVSDQYSWKGNYNTVCSRLGSVW